MGIQPSRPSSALNYFQPGNSSSSRLTLTFSPDAISAETLKAQLEAELAKEMHAKNPS